MIYQNTQIYTANGTADEPIKNTIKTGIGILYKIEVYFPPGCCGLTNIRLLYNERQIYPLPVNSYFRGENNAISFEDTFLIDQNPHEIVIEGFNVDTLYDHLTVVRLGFESDPDYISRYIPPSISELIKELQQKEKYNTELAREILVNRLKLLAKEDKRK